MAHDIQGRPYAARIFNLFRDDDHDLQWEYREIEKLNISDKERETYRVLARESRSTLNGVDRRLPLNHHELAELTGLPAHEVSAHLSTLHKCDLVSREKRRRSGFRLQNYYWLRCDDALPEVLVTSLDQDDPQALADEAALLEDPKYRRIALCAVYRAKRDEMQAEHANKVLDKWVR